MTRSTNARLAGVGYVSYIVVGILNEVLMYRATSVEGTAAKLARIADYSTDVRLAMILKLAECFSAFALGVALYGITRSEDNELAMLGLLCRVAEGTVLIGFDAFNLERRWIDERESGDIDTGRLQRLAQSLHFAFGLDPQRIVGLHAQNEMHAALEIEAELDHLVGEPCRLGDSVAGRDDRIHANGREDHRHRDDRDEFPA